MKRRAKSTAERVDAAWKVLVKLTNKHDLADHAHEDELDFHTLVRSEQGMTEVEFTALKGALRLVRTQLGYVPKVPREVK